MLTILQCLLCLTYILAFVLVTLAFAISTSRRHYTTLEDLLLREEDRDV